MLFVDDCERKDAIVAAVVAVGVAAIVFVENDDRKDGAVVAVAVGVVVV